MSKHEKLEVRGFRKRNRSIGSLSEEQRASVLESAAKKASAPLEAEGGTRLHSFRKTIKQRLPRRSHEAPADAKDMSRSVDQITRVGGSRIQDRLPTINLELPQRGKTAGDSPGRSTEDLDPSVCQAKLTTLFYELQGNSSTLNEVTLQHFGITPLLAQDLVQALKYNTVVTKLDLSHNKLGDPGALVIFSLLRENSSITWLDMSFNNITGAIVKKARKVLQGNTELRYMHFAEAPSLGMVRLKKPCLPVEHHMHGLKPLLAANQLIHKAVVGKTAVLQMSGRRARAIPLQILGLTHLMELSMDNNLISYLPPSLSQLRQLRIVDLRSNKLTKVCSEIHHLVDLEVLDVSDNLLENLPFSVASLTSLKSLNMSKNRLCSPERVPLRIISLQSCMKNLDITGNEVPLLDFNKMPETLWSEKLPLKRFQLLMLGFGQCGKSTLVQMLRRRQLEGEQLAEGDVQEILNNQVSHKHDVYQYAPWFPCQAGCAAEQDLQTSSRQQRTRTRLDIETCEVSSGLTGDDERVYYDLARLVMPASWTIFTVVFRLLDDDVEELVQQQLLWINAIRHASGRNVGTRAASAEAAAQSSPLRASAASATVSLRSSSGSVAAESPLGVAGASPVADSSLAEEKKRSMRETLRAGLALSVPPLLGSTETFALSTSGTHLGAPLPVVLVATYTEEAQTERGEEVEARVAELRERLGGYVFAVVAVCLDGAQAESDVGQGLEPLILECTECLEESTVPLDRRFLWLRERLEVEKELHERRLSISRDSLREMAARCNLTKEEEVVDATRFLAAQGSLLPPRDGGELLFVNANGIAKAVLLLLANSSLAMSLGEASVISRSAVEDIWREQFSAQEIDACLLVLRGLGLVAQLEPEGGSSSLAGQLRRAPEPYFLLSILFITCERSKRMHALLTPKPSYLPTLVNYQMKWIPPWMFLRVVATLLLHLPDHIEVEYIWREGQCKFVSQRTDDMLLLRCPEWQHCFAATVWDRGNTVAAAILEPLERYFASDDCNGLFIAKETQVLDGK